jgi:hypothetical protein
VGLKSLKSLNLTNGYPNKNKNKNKNNNNNNKVKSKPLELFELAGKKHHLQDQTNKGTIFILLLDLLLDIHTSHRAQSQESQY